jgi:hypothetical protein
MVRYTLDSIIRELLIETGENTENKYTRYLQLALSGLRTMSFSFAGTPKIAELTKNANDTIDLPKDYVNYIRIAILDRNNNLCALGQNNNMSLSPIVNNCGDPVSPASVRQPTSGRGDSFSNTPGNGIVWSQDGYSDNWRNGELVGRFFGIGGGNNPYGYFRVNQDTGQVELGGVAADVIMLEYLSDPTKEGCCEHFVHPYLVESIKLYVQWKVALNNERRSLGEKDMFKSLYYNEYNKAKLSFNNTSLTDWYSAFRYGNKEAPKF